MAKRVWDWVDEFGVGAESATGSDTESVSTGNGTIGSVTVTNKQTKIAQQ